MRTLPLFFFAAAACAEPPSSVNPGVAQPGAAQPGNAQPNDGSAQVGGAGEDVSTGSGTALAGADPGAVVPSGGSTDDPPAADPAHTQDALVDGTTLSGELICTDCTGALLVRIEDASTRPPALLAKKSFEEAGPFSMTVPKDKQLIVMVIHDENGDSMPTPGEALGLWTGGLVNSATDVTEIQLTVGVMPDTPPVEEDAEATPAADQ